MRGKRIWYFPDAEVPPRGNDPEVYGHESVILLNPNDEDACVAVTLYFTNREPTRGITVQVGAGRVNCVRVTAQDGFCGAAVQEGEQYAIGLESDTPVIAQYGRLDVRQSNMAFYTTPGYME